MRGRGGNTHFVLLASDGRVVATQRNVQVEGVLSQKGIAAVKRLAADASVIEADAAPGADGGKRGKPQRATPPPSSRRGSQASRGGRGERAEMPR